MRSLNVIVIALVLLVTGVASAQSRQKIAILGVEPEDAQSAKVAGWITEGMRQRAAKATNRFELPASGKKDLAELKLLSDCLDEKVDCMVAIGKELGVDRVLFGKVTRNKAGTYTLTLKYLDVGARKLEKGPYQKDLPANEATEEGAKKLAATAFTDITGIQAAGSIEIQANVDTGTVSVDGTVRGPITGRAASISDLPEGTYQITIEAPGMKTWSQTVTVHAGAPTLVTASLEAEGSNGQQIEIKPPHEDKPVVSERPGGGYRVAFWTSLAVTAVGATTFTVTGMKVRSLEDDKIAAIDASNGVITSGPNDDACAEADAKGYAPVQGICSDGKKYATMTNVFIGVTAVAALAAGFFYYKGYIDSKPTASDKPGAARKGGKGSGIIITPQIGPHGAGLGATITF